MIVLIMGVSGSGKTSIGHALAQELSVPFIEGDDFHPPANREKMAAGTPLNDADRAPWLESLAKALRNAEATGEGAVMACSALKRSYREVLEAPLTAPLHIVHLHTSREVLLKRLNNRKGHFFPPELLDSQLDTLEPPADAIVLDVSEPLEVVIQKGVAALRSASSTSNGDDA